jgi:hypothetical protein
MELAAPDSTGHRQTAVRAGRKGGTVAPNLELRGRSECVSFTKPGTM